jgi:hypothetical protein
MRRTIIVEVLIATLSDPAVEADVFFVAGTGILIT